LGHGVYGFTRKKREEWKVAIINPWIVLLNGRPIACLQRVAMGREEVKQGWGNNGKMGEGTEEASTF